MDIIKEVQDYTMLEWTRTRHSSGTAGSFLKAYQNQRGKKIYYKLSNYDVVNGITGIECINEILVDRLLHFMEVPHLSYKLIHAKVRIRGKETVTWMCASYDFKKAGESKIALDAYYEMEAVEGESPIEFCIRQGFGEYIYQMLIVDFLILNRDRHGANIEILKQSKTKTLRPAPLFDHGLSLMFSCKNNEQIQNYDPKEDKRVQCFVGSSSTWQNLALIPKEHRKPLPVFDKKLKEYLFTDIDDIMGAEWMNAVWNFLIVRADLYESFRNS